MAQGRARYLLDSVSLVPERSWDSVREELAANFEEASQQAPPPRTRWTRRVPHPVLIGHAASQQDMARLVRADAQ